MSNFDDKLAQHISEISKEKQPERDLWRGIELGITSQQGDASQDDASSSTVTSKQWMAISASVCLVTVLLFFIFEIQNVINKIILTFFLFADYIDL